MLVIMTKIIFIIGPISSGKSTLAKLIKNSVIIEIDDIYESNFNGKEFSQAYSNKKFQKICWEKFYDKIKMNKLNNKSVVALTTGLNPMLKPLLKKLKKEFPKEVYLIKLKSDKDTLASRTIQRKGIQKRTVLATLDTYQKLEKQIIKADFMIDSSQDLKSLKKRLRDILRSIQNHNS